MEVESMLIHASRHSFEVILVQLLYDVTHIP